VMQYYLIQMICFASTIQKDASVLKTRRDNRSSSSISSPPEGFGVLARKTPAFWYDETRDSKKSVISISLTGCDASNTYWLCLVTRLAPSSQKGCWRNIF